MTAGEIDFVPSQRRVSALRRIRGVLFGLVPLAVWCASIAGVCYLASVRARPLDYPGMALVTRYVVASPERAQLRDLLVTEQAQVEKGQRIGRLCDSALKLDLKELRLSIRALEAEREREKGLLNERSERDRVGRDNDLRRFQRDVEDAQIGVLRLQATIEEDRLKLAASQVDLAVEAGLSEMNLAAEASYERTGYEVKALQKSIEENGRVLDMRREKLSLAKKRLEDFRAGGPVQGTDVDTVLSTFAWRIKVLQNKVEMIELERTQLDLRAPASGHVTQVHVRAGELVDRGRPVVTIVAGSPRGAVAYVPADTAQGMRGGMAAIVECSTLPGTTVKTRVLKTGPAVVEVPERLRTQPRVREWAIPVYLELAPEMLALPGESIRVRILP